MKVYVVVGQGPEQEQIYNIHRTHKGALKEWNKVRLGLLAHARQALKADTSSSDMWQEMIKNLSCEDPEKIDNYPHETPYIQEYEVEE